MPPLSSPLILTLSVCFRSGSTHSLAVSTTLSIGTAGGGADETDQSEETKRARMEMLAALKARREALVAKLDEKNRLLKGRRKRILCTRIMVFKGMVFKSKYWF